MLVVDVAASLALVLPSADLYLLGLARAFELVPVPPVSVALAFEHVALLVLADAPVFEIEFAAASSRTAALLFAVPPFESGLVEHAAQIVVEHSLCW